MIPNPSTIATIPEVPLALVTVGLLGLILAGAMRKPGRSAPRRRRPWTIPAAVAVAVSMVWTSTAYALPSTGYTSNDTTYLNPSPYNGYKVYLSSPRHIDSGSRGECGWDENINGRHWNLYAAGGPSNSQNLLSRGYKITISPNNKNNGSSLNAASANNWGAHVYIVTHTNASGGCLSSAKYLLVMYRSGVANSSALRTNLLNNLNSALPGGTNTWNCDGLIECNSVNASWRAYTELFFHDNQSSVTWFEAGGGDGDGILESWRYGWAVDLTLGYP